MADPSTENSSSEATPPPRTEEGPGAALPPEGEVPQEGEGGEEEFPGGRVDPGGSLLRGTPVAHGLAFGLAHRKDDDLERTPPQRLPLDQVEAELERFQNALELSRVQLEELKVRLGDRVPADHKRILDVHLAYLKDSVFLADVENLILNQQLSLEAAIAKVVGDFDRIFRLVENDTLRERAVDLRDVGIRVLRNIERELSKKEEAAPVERPATPENYILVARELSIVDMFNLRGDHVLGIVTEGGGLTSHAAILARSMRIPTLTGVDGLLDVTREGDFLIVDASEGLVRVNPDDLVREQYAEARLASESAAQGEVPDWAQGPLRTLDEEPIQVRAACGTLPEVERATELGMSGVGIYRTELMYLIDSDLPSADVLANHYAGVFDSAARLSEQGPVTFRLLDADSGLRGASFHQVREPNPELGCAGVRLLLTREQLLRTQLRALLSASRGSALRIAVPFVSDLGELRRVREVLFEERFALRKIESGYEDRVELGAILETPAAALGAAALAQEADFLVISLDGLSQYMLAADRQNLDLADHFVPLHPVVLRTVAQIVEDCRAHDTPLSIYGVTSRDPKNLPLLLGAGLREFCISPATLQEFRQITESIDLRQARFAVRAAQDASSREELLDAIERSSGPA